MVAYVNSVEVICNRICSARREWVGRRERIVCVWIAQHRDSRLKPGFALRLTVLATANVWFEAAYGTLRSFRSYAARQLRRNNVSLRSAAKPYEVHLYG